ncbi:MAG: pectate lyase [Bacteroidaceae bacterium]
MNRMQAWCLALLLACGSMAGRAQTETLAFPGAEGYGAYTTGGRGGRVVCVTSLADEGEGTLRAALQKEGPRIIVFKVGGTIFLSRSLDINKGDVTIAGQTAPGQGITIAGYPVKIKASNVIIRYLRFRLGDINQVEDDAINCMGGRNGKPAYENIIIDHCTMSWSTDECATFYGNRYFTLQWCLISESLRKSVHAKGEHGYGGIWGGDGATFHHNLLAHHDSRNPRFCHPGITDVAGVIDFRNNVIYNWGKNGPYGADTRTVNMVNNYFKPGPATEKNRSRILQPYYPYGKFYVDGNYVDGEEGVSASNWKGVKPKAPDTGEEVPLISLMAFEPFPYEAVNTQSAQDAYRSVLAGVGCSLVRDDIDKRIIKEVKKGSYTYGQKGLIDSQEQVGGFLMQEMVTDPEPDSDGDGMPDRWEQAHGLNPQDAADASACTLDKAYTNIEVYINSLVK